MMNEICDPDREFPTVEILQRFNFRITPEILDRVNLWHWAATRGGKDPEWWDQMLDMHDPKRQSMAARWLKEHPDRQYDLNNLYN